MKFKKYFLILTLFMVLMCCISAASAASDDALNDLESEIDQGDDSISVSDDEQVVDDDSNGPELSAQDDGKLEATDDSSELAADQSDEMLSSVSADKYSITFNKEYTISSYSKSSVKFSVTPPSGTQSYSFKLVVYDLEVNSVYTSGSFTGRATSKTWTINANTLAAGTYILAAVNDYDDKIMAATVLKVSGKAVITANNYNGFWGRGTLMSAKITDANNGKPLKSVSVKVTFTRGKTTVTKYYIPNDNGVIAFVPPVAAGNWRVTFSVAYEGQTHISVPDVVKTASVKKSKVAVKAMTTWIYQGYTSTVKVIVKSWGKNVNGGTVLIKINNRLYKAPVKNGAAVLKLKLPQAKIYKFNAIYLGTANLYKSKLISGKTTVYKRVATTIVFPKKLRLYTGISRTGYIRVKGADGKFIQNGKIIITGPNGERGEQPIINGKAEVRLYGYVTDLYKGNNGYSYYYKKSLTKKYRITFVSANPRYKNCVSTFTGTSLFKCPDCGQTRTHTHIIHDYFYSYKIKIVVS